MRVVGKAAEPPKWIKPQLTRNADEAPAGEDWLHEIKYDGYRMHARLERDRLIMALAASISLESWDQLRHSYGLANRSFWTMLSLMTGCVAH